MHKWMPEEIDKTMIYFVEMTSIWVSMQFGALHKVFARKMHFAPQANSTPSAFHEE